MKRYAVHIIPALVAVVLWSSLAGAQEKVGYQAYFKDGKIVYQISDKKLSQEVIEVDATAGAAVMISPLDPPDMTLDYNGWGEGFVNVQCTATGQGSVTISMRRKKTTQLLFIKTLGFSCTGAGQNPSSVGDVVVAANPLPALSGWGTLCLLIFLAVTALWVFRKRRAASA